MNESAILHNAADGHTKLMALWQTVKPWLIAGHPLVVTIKGRKRSLPQNARLHARISEIARDRTWAGQRLDVETWKRLLTASWMRANGRHATILPALDGHGFDLILPRTSDLDVAECADLMEWIDAWDSMTEPQK